MSNYNSFLKAYNCLSGNPNQSAALNIAFPTLSNNEARALSWGGLQKTSKWNLLTSTQRNEIEAIQTQYSTKTSSITITSKGTYCQ